MKKFCLALLVLAIPITFLAQTPGGHRVRVEVQIDSTTSLHSVSIVLMGMDSSVVRLGATDRNGVLEFEQISTGDYIIKASHTGYKTQFLSPARIGATPTFVWKVRLAADEKVLAGVVVTTKKPMVQFLPDRPTRS